MEKNHPKVCTIAIIIYFYFIFLIIQEGSAAEPTGIRVPEYAVLGQSVRLECNFELEGEDSLFIVKWYKDDHEFYRYLPNDHPPSLTFSLPGIQVDLSNSSDKVVLLKSVNFGTSGVYTCEFTLERTWKTFAQASRMTVVSLPDDAPHISGGKSHYYVGEIARINCTASESMPSASLSWFINEELAGENLLQKYQTPNTHIPVLSVLGVQFTVTEDHFKKGVMEIKCVSQIEDFYWRTTEERFFKNDRPANTPNLSMATESEKKEENVVEEEVDSTVSSDAASYSKCTSELIALILFFILQ